MIKKKSYNDHSASFVPVLSFMLQFQFQSEMSRPSWFEFTTAILRIHISLRSLHLMQYVRLLLFCSIIFPVRHFPVRHFPVRHFSVLQIPPLRFRPSLSSPANSTPSTSSVIFQSCKFQSCKFSYRMYRNVTSLQTSVTFRTAFSCISIPTIYSTFQIMHIPPSRIFHFPDSVVLYKQWIENAWLDNDRRSVGHTHIDWYALEFRTFWKNVYNTWNISPGTKEMMCNAEFCWAVSHSCRRSSSDIELVRLSSLGGIAGCRCSRMHMPTNHSTYRGVFRDLARCLPLSVRFAKLHNPQYVQCESKSSLQKYFLQYFQSG